MWGNYEKDNVFYKYFVNCWCVNYFIHVKQVNKKSV